MSRRIELPQGKSLERFTQQLKAVSRKDVAIFPSGEELSGRFVLGGLIGNGPYGQVFHATDKELEVEVAIKVLETTWLKSQKAKTRFERTMKNARKMTQKNIVRVHQHGVHRDHAWISMQHLDGLSLRKLMKMKKGKKEVFELDEVDRIVSQLVAALGHIGKYHAHGDLKPENIIFLPDMLKVTDHFLAQSISPASLARGQKESAYLAPELSEKSAKLTKRCDIYSLGAIVSEVMFGTTTPPGDLALDGDVVRLEVAQLCRRAMSKNPEQRPASFEAFSEDFATAVDQQELTATSSLIMTSDKLTPPPAPVPIPPPPSAPMPSFDFEPAADLVEEDIATVEVKRDAKGEIPVLGDLLPTNEVSRSGAPLPVAPKSPASPMASSTKESTKTVNAPKPEGGSKDDDKGGFPLLPVLLGLALVIVIVAVVASQKPKEVTIGDEPVSKAQPPTNNTENKAATPTNNITTPKKELVATVATTTLADATSVTNNNTISTLSNLAVASSATAAPTTNLVVAAVDPKKKGEAKPTNNVITSPKPSETTAKPTTAKAVAVKSTKEPEVKDENAPKTSCPQGMTLLKSKTKPYVCLDRYEYPGRGAKPKTRVSWFQAKKMCESKGKRLCARGEWRRGCGGKYPWGKAWNPDKCNTQDEDGFERSLAAAGSKKSCRSRSGAYDMVGNVFEWTAEKRIVGGSYNSGESVASCGYSSGKSPSSSSGDIGFRCCADPS